jgi:hypothetical protein
VSKQEYAGLSGQDLAFFKGRKYALLAPSHNLEDSACQKFRRPPAASKRLNTNFHHQGDRRVPLILPQQVVGARLCGSRRTLVK